MKSVLFIIVFLMLVVILGIAGISREQQTPPVDTIQLTAYNKHFFGVGILVKCDWIGKDKEKPWKFFGKYYLRKRSKTVMDVPKNVKRCQIWSKLGRFKDKK